MPLSAFEFIFHLEVQLDDGNPPKLVERIRKLAAATIQVSGSDGLRVDEVNLEEFANLMDRLVQLMRRANASGHENE